MPTVIPNKTIEYLIEKYKINRDVLTPAIIREGIRSEMEHRDIIGDDLEAAFRIALAHWRETNSRYYKRLKTMERSLRDNKRFHSEKMFL
jgi:hypothetical protein